MDDESDWDEPTWTYDELLEKVDDMVPCSLFLMQAIRNDIKHNHIEQMQQRLMALNPIQLNIFLKEYQEWNVLQEKAEADKSEYVTDDFSDEDD